MQYSKCSVNISEATAGLSYPTSGIMLGEPGLGLDYDSKAKTLNHFMAFILKQHLESTSNLELLKVNFGLSN